MWDLNTVGIRKPDFEWDLKSGSLDHFKSGQIATGQKQFQMVQF